MLPVNERKGLSAWLPVIGLAIAAFVYNSSEFLPVGLLPDMARGLGENVSDMGLVITGYAWVVALMSLPLTILTARLERRKLLLALLALFALAHFVVPWVNSFESLLAARILVALTHSVFWSIMTPLAARMAPRGKRAVGLASVMGGSIVATVLGVPLGTHLGQLFGWQEAFFAVGLAAAGTFALILTVLPEAPSSSAGSLASLPKILRRPALIELYLLTAVAILGEFTAYSFISPILTEGAGLAEETVVTILLVFGLSGIIGTVVSAKTVERHPSATLTAALCVITLSLGALLPAAQTGFALLVLLVVFWGAAVTAVSMAFQTILLNVARDAADVATSLYSGIFNIGIGGGAFVGSFVSLRMGFEPVPFVGAALVALTAFFCLGLIALTGSAVLPGAEPREAGVPVNTEENGKKQPDISKT